MPSATSDQNQEEEERQEGDSILSHGVRRIRDRYVGSYNGQSAFSH